MQLKSMKANKKSIMVILSVLIVAVLFVPVLYSIIYLGSIWDVYNKLNTVPVAVVNLDKPVTKDGKNYSLGQDIINNLKNNKDAEWKFVSYNDAMSGIKSDKYYAVIEVPNNFSQNIADTQDGKFNKPQIIYIANQGENFIFSEVSSKMATSIKDQVDSSIQKEISKTLVDKLYDVKSSIKTASDGANNLQSGTEKLTSGSNTLLSGTSSAKDGAKQLYTGLQTITTGETNIVNGYPSLINGLNSLKNSLTQPNSQIPQLVSGASTLNTNTTAIAEQSGILDQSVSKVTSGVEQSDAILHSELVAIGSSNLSAADKYKLEEAINGLDQLSTQNGQNPAPLNAVAGGVHNLSEALTSLNSGTEEISNGIGAIATGINNSQSQAANGVGQLISGALALQSGSNNVLAGLSTVTSKTGQLTDGLDKLNSGAEAINSGLKTASDGASKLDSGLSSGYDKINNSLKFSSVDMSNFISNPVTIKDNSINVVKHYGQGLAPYFISLSLWIGALFASLILSVTKKLKLFKGKILNNFAIRVLLGSIYVALQSIIVSFALVTVLNISPVNVTAFYLLNILVAVTFFNVMFGVSNAIGLAGAPVMFVFLIIQLGSSAGTFPIQTAPQIYRVINSVIPMTYSVDCLRMTISGIDYSLLLGDIKILVGFTLAFLAIGFFVGEAFKVIKNRKVETKAAKAA
jgi:putative membrane protein